MSDSEQAMEYDSPKKPPTHLLILGGSFPVF
ncbi:hypothetical protein [Bacillus mojavensis]|nr:hypothetical protein [Bacillus mojavensis]MEC1749605.1 hypothetical protein [Bacillus mojavensis]